MSCSAFPRNWCWRVFIGTGTIFSSSGGIDPRGKTGAPGDERRREMERAIRRQAEWSSAPRSNPVPRVGRFRALGGLLKKPLDRGKPPSFRRKPESILTFHRAERPRLCWRATPQCGICAAVMTARGRFHRWMKMDSGFRRNDEQRRRAKPPSRIGRRFSGHHFPLEGFFNSPRGVRVLRREQVLEGQGEFPKNSIN